MVTVEFDFIDEPVRLALVAEEYVDGGLAILLLDATDPHAENYMAEWGMLTMNVPSAAEQSLDDLCVAKSDEAEIVAGDTDMTVRDEIGNEK